MCTLPQDASIHMLFKNSMEFELILEYCPCSTSESMQNCHANPWASGCAFIYSCIYLTSAEFLMLAFLDMACSVQ